MQRLSIICSSRLTDYHRVGASNQYVKYALSVLMYFMWTQTWPLADLQQLDGEARKVIVENAANHPLGSVAQLYMSRKTGGRDLRSVKAECKNTKIKAAVK